MGKILVAPGRMPDCENEAVPPASERERHWCSRVCATQRTAGLSFVVGVLLADLSDDSWVE